MGDRTEQLAFESAVNRRYLAALEQHLRRSVSVDVAANEKWVENVPTDGRSLAGLSPLIGRVALNAHDEDLGTSFYIGARHLRKFEHPVISWAAPLAQVFFEPSTCVLPLAQDVRARRSLVTKKSQVVDYDDEWTPGARDANSPFEQQRLEVPEAPAPSRRRRTVDQPKPTPEPETEAPQATAEVVASPNTSGLRAEELVRRSLARPRTDALASVLSTLQPQQYQLVTSDPEQTSIVQGHPGTGKTIIASHRAAFLVNDEREGGRAVDRLLFIGPTDEWAAHVRDVVRSLGGAERVSVKSMRDFQWDLSGFRHDLGGWREGSREDVGRFVSKFVDQAVELCRSEGPWAVGGRAARMDNLERLYNVIRREGTESGRLRLGDLSRQWVPTLPAFGTAVRQQRYLPLFAYMSLAIAGGKPQPYGHIIVDEAQDFSGLEWQTLRAHNPRGRWSLFGDTNQRRNDFVNLSWEDTARHLGISSVTPISIAQGFRSTQQILDLAKSLLPRDQRTATSVQEAGKPPEVLRVQKSALAAESIQQAERLCEAYAPGTVAVIATDPATLEKTLIKRGWRRDGGRIWAHKERGKVRLHDPYTARGVEFDAVVVVEPDLFPKAITGPGPLYTSLTRANRDLAIVHAQQLPDGLRQKARNLVKKR